MLEFFKLIFLEIFDLKVPIPSKRNKYKKLIYQYIKKEI